MNGDHRYGSRGEHELQGELGTGQRAARFYAQQVVGRLTPAMQDFISRQEMMFVASADNSGECDNSFRAGPPGFIHVLDAARLAYPEYRGNGVMASLGNIRESGRVGLLFLDFARDLVGLHVNGRAQAVPREELMRQVRLPPEDDQPGRRTALWVVVDVEEAYIHCSKHIPRLVPLPRQRHWGSDDQRPKGGDYFEVAAEGSGPVTQPLT